MNSATLCRALLACAVLIGSAARGQQPESSALNMQNLNFDTLAILTGGGGHTIMFSTETSVVVVDSKLPGLGPKVVEAAATWTDNKPVTTLINTHAHPDHVGGNSAFAGKLEIVAHENTRANMAKMEDLKGQNEKFLPNRTFRDKLSLAFGRDRVDMYYFGEGHTNGDAVVVFPAQRVAYFGDLFPGKMVPVVDVTQGGNLLTFPQTLQKALGEIKGVGRVIPSHAPPPEGRRLHSQGRSWMSWADFQEYASFMRDLVETVKQAHKAGKTVAQAVDVARTTLPQTYPGYDLAGADAAVRATYDALSRTTQDSVPRPSR